MKKNCITYPAPIPAQKTETAIIRELRSTLNTLTHAIQAGEQESIMKIHNLNKRIGDLEENNAKLYKRVLAIDRRQGISDGDILALNGAILTMGGKDVSNFKALPASTMKQTTIEDIFGKKVDNSTAPPFQEEEQEGEPEPFVEITGIELHGGGKQCTIKF